MADSENHVFPTTHASLIDLVARKDHSQFQAAWDIFFRGYWPPLYCYLRRLGCPPQDALDVLQDFFIEGVETPLLGTYDAQRGRFRHFLTGCLKNRLLLARRTRQSRPEKFLLSFDPATVEAIEAGFNVPSPDGPERAFGIDWARLVLERSVDALERALPKDNGGASLRILREWLLNTNRPPAAELAAALKIETGTLYTRASRLRQDLLAEVEKQVRLYSAGEEEAERERDEILGCLAD